MQTKLTLRLDNDLITRAKIEADKRGKSVSQMVAEFFGSLWAQPPKNTKNPPITASLTGVIRGKSVSEKDYKRHLREKYL